MLPLSPREKKMSYNDIWFDDDAVQSRTSFDGQKLAVTIEPIDSLPPRIISPSSLPSSLPGPRLFQNHFFSHDATISAARRQYIKMFARGTLAVTLLIFTVLSLFWASLFRTPVRPLPAWIVDFDRGLIGQTVRIGLLATNPTLPSRIQWSVISADLFPNGTDDVVAAVREQKIWMVVTINSGASNRLTAALLNPTSTYNGSQAVSVFGAEARNENAFRVFLRPTVEAALATISSRFAVELARSQGDSPVLSQLLTTSPQTLTAPISYQLHNILPFDQPVATAVTFTGLIFLLILSFFTVMIGNSARELTNIRRLLSLPSLIAVRITTSMVTYFLLSLFYSLLSLAFQLNVSRKFGHSGFLVFWMLNFCAMSALGLALEAMLTLITVSFLPFFMLGWVICNIAVCIFPIEVLPILFRYGYAAPFYNVSAAIRTIVFGTKNEVGFHFGILIIWIIISCITIPLLQIWSRRQDIAATRGR